MVTRARGAARQVAVPEGLDLDAWIHPPEEDEEDEDEDDEQASDDELGADAGEVDGDAPRDKKAKKKRREKEGWEDDDFGGARPQSPAAA